MSERIACLMRHSVEVYSSNDARVCVSDRGAEPLCQPLPSGEAGRHQPVRDGVRRSAWSYRFLSGRSTRQTSFSKSTALHYYDYRRRLLHQHRTGNVTCAIRPFSWFLTASVCASVCPHKNLENYLSEIDVTW